MSDKNQAQETMDKVVGRKIIIGVRRFNHNDYDNENFELMNWQRQNPTLKVIATQIVERGYPEIHLDLSKSQGIRYQSSVYVTYEKYEEINH